MNKFTLKYELDLDFVLIALTVPLKDYRVCYQINKHLDSRFQRIDELILSATPDRQPQYFSRYYFRSDNPETDYYLVANKGSEGFLVTEMKTVDFFIIVKNFIDDEDLEKLLSGLNRISEVQVAAEVDPKKLKSKENLIF